MPSILFVCSANQCRSPMAEALFKSMLEETGQRNAWRVESAGIWAYEGVPATAFARQTMQDRGLNIEDHRSQAVSADLLEAFDLILVMEDRHRRYLQTQFPGQADRVYMMSAIAGPEVDIDDPVTGTLETYEATVERMEDLLERGNERILEWVKDRS